ncbi:MAG TPA: DUF1800 domain-containing protein [Gemmataceae bacterium]|nr:DUF1800 domain-containing protein [Gemmataceae bacterium]
MATPLPSLNSIDPIAAWKPWQPSKADPWGHKWAAHLYRRAAFGSSRADLLEAEHLGFEGTLDLLVQGRPEANGLLETLTDIGRVAAACDDGGEQLRGWWLYCMLHGGHPLREKLTLFWHNHFATSLAKVQSVDMMFRQNCLLRVHALGQFGPLLQAISRDPAMLLWLDSNSNVKGKPNENYARELMELFSLGVGHYTERDIRAAARAFTGWRTDGERFVFHPDIHDGGSKTVLGQTGPWDGGDIVRILLEQPATANFLVRKLYHFFISENANPPDAFLEPLCDSFRQSNYHIVGLVRTMLASRHFYSDHAFRQRIKSPVEFVLGAVQAVYRRYADADAEYRPLPQQLLVERLSMMGQELFTPPNVKGWPGGRSWLNTSTLLARDNFAGALAMGTLWGEMPPKLTQKASTAMLDRPVPPKAFDAARLPQEEAIARPEEIVRVLLELHVPGGIGPAARSKLVAYLAEGQPVGSALAQRVRETVHAILSMAEYQLA